MGEKIKIGLIGLGTVGGSVARILLDDKERIAQKAGVELEIYKACVRDAGKYSDFTFPITQNLDELLEDDEVDIIVELMGGVEYPFEVAKRVLGCKKAFVTANKAMLAYHAQELLHLAGGIPLGFEASVCGGIPIIEMLRDGLVANEFCKIEGILNGTSNFILSKMMEEKCDFSLALQSAQSLGYAEADPSLDINGMDAGHKLLILAKMAYGIDAKPEEILIEGIEKIDLEDLCFANELGYMIKLVGIAQKEGEMLDVRLHPALVRQLEPLAQVSGVKNAVTLSGDYTGEVFVSGFGAGGDATASAVIADLVNIARLRKVVPYPYPPFGSFARHSVLKLKPKGEIESAYYVCFAVLDDYGVLAQITSNLAKVGISVNQILQKSSKTCIKIIITTHRTKEKEIDLALKNIEDLGILIEKPHKIRING